MEEHRDDLTMYKRWKTRSSASNDHTSFSSLIFHDLFSLLDTVDYFCHHWIDSICYLLLLITPSLPPSILLSLKCGHSSCLVLSSLLDCTSHGWVWFWLSVEWLLEGTDVFQLSIFHVSMYKFSITAWHMEYWNVPRDEILNNSANDFILSIVRVSIFCLPDSSSS